MPLFLSILSWVDSASSCQVPLIILRRGQPLLLRQKLVPRVSALAGSVHSGQSCRWCGCMWVKGLFWLVLQPWPAVCAAARSPWLSPRRASWLASCCTRLSTSGRRSLARPSQPSSAWRRVRPWLPWWPRCRWPLSPTPPPYKPFLLLPALPSLSHRWALPHGWMLGTQVHTAVWVNTVLQVNTCHAEHCHTGKESRTGECLRYR